MGTQNDALIHTQGESFLNISTIKIIALTKTGNGNGNKGCNNTKTYCR